MAYWPLRIVRQVAGLALTAIAGAAITAAMVHSGPGYDSDERLLDPRLNAASRAAIRVRHLDLGYSETFHAPVTALIGERWKETAALMAAGVAGGWLAAALIAVIAVTARRKWISGAADLMGAAGLCVPTAAVAVLVFVAGGPERAVIALVLFPRLYDTLRNLLGDAYAAPAVLNARALGVRPVAIFMKYVLPGRGAELLALAGISVAIAFGACIPVETICDLPGIGQLAWKAAVARDLPVLVALTVLIAMLTQLGNAAAEWVGESREARA